MKSKLIIVIITATLIILNIVFTGNISTQAQPVEITSNLMYNNQDTEVIPLKVKLKKSKSTRRSKTSSISSSSNHKSNTNYTGTGNSLFGFIVSIVISIIFIIGFVLLKIHKKRNNNHKDTNKQRGE